MENIEIKSIEPVYTTNTDSGEVISTVAVLVTFRHQNAHQHEEENMRLGCQVNGEPFTLSDKDILMTELEVSRQSWIHNNNWDVELPEVDPELEQYLPGGS